jgi:hypothetical protein
VVGFSALNIPLVSGIEFKIATSQSELEQAYALLYDNYYQNGTIEASRSRLYLNYYNLLPQMSTLIALQGNRVIGTVGVINNKVVILHDQSDHQDEVHSSPGNKSAQILDFAITKGDRNIQPQVKFYLMKYAYEYCRDYLLVENIIIAVNKNRTRFFQDIFGFEEQQTKPQNLGSQLIILGINLASAYDHLAINFGRFKDSNNYFTFFTKLDAKAVFTFPKREYYSSLDPVMTPRLLEHFFAVKSDLLRELTMEQYEYLKYLYDSKEFMELIPVEIAKLTHISFRRGKRFPVNCRGKLLCSNPVDIEINNVSPNGFSATLESNQEMLIGEHFDVNILIGEFKISNIKAKLVWKKSKAEYGFSLIKSSQNWSKFIAHLVDKYKIETPPNTQDAAPLTKSS